MTAAARRAPATRLSRDRARRGDRRAAADRAEADGPARRRRPADQRRAAPAAASRWRAPAPTISLADIVEAVEGPIAMTTASDGASHDCALDAALPGQAAHGRSSTTRVRGALGRQPVHACQEAGRDERSSRSTSATAKPSEAADRPGLRMGLLLRHRAGVRAQGPERGHRPLHLGQEERARMDARMAAQGLSRLAEMEEVDWAKLDIPRDRLPGRLLLRRAQGEAEARQPRRGRSRDPARLREARHPDRGAEGARRRRGRAQGRGRRGVRQRLGRDHLPRGAEGARASSSSRSARRSANIPSWCRKYLGKRRAAARQLLRLPEQRGLLRRHLRLRARGRALPDGAVAPISASMPRIPASSSAP